MCKRIKRLKTTGGVIAISLVSSIAWIVKAQTPKDVSAGQRVVAEEKGSAAASMPRGFSATEADYVAPKKPLPPLTRVGVETSEPLPLTLNEAIRLALVNNNDITTSRIEVEMSEDDLNAARGAYDPRMTSEFYFQHNKLPLTSFLGGNSNGALSTNNFEQQLRRDRKLSARRRQLQVRIRFDSHVDRQLLQRSQSGAQQQFQYQLHAASDARAAD